jgi:hypothetical protein
LILYRKAVAEIPVIGGDPGISTKVRRIYGIPGPME